MPENLCPSCSRPLHKITTDLGVLWACEFCKGRAVTVALLRRQVDRDFMNRLWQDVRSTPRGNHLGGRLCPACRNPMLQIGADGVGERFQIDACKTCQFLWFDESETAQLPILSPNASAEPELDAKAREAVALAKVKLLREQADREENRPMASPVDVGNILSQAVMWLLEKKIR